MTRTATLTKNAIFTQYNYARAIARDERMMIDTPRLNRALGLLLKVAAGTYSPDPDYTTTQWGCTCPDSRYRRHKVGPCKHQLAAILYHKIHS